VTMPVYRAAFRARVVKQLIGPQAVSATQLAKAVGVPQPTCQRSCEIPHPVIA
jgi:hypothetical protein